MEKTTVLLFCFFLYIDHGCTERITKSWKNTTEGIDFKIKKSLFIKFSNKKFKITQDVNIIQQTYQSTLTNCGKACQDVESCLSFLFRRNMQHLNCLLVDHSVKIVDLEDDGNADYYEIQVK